MNGDDHEERRAVVKVTDRPIEINSMVQTILTFLLLGVMSWVGLTLEKVKENTAVLTTKIAVSASEVAHNRELIINHISDDRVHK